MKEQSSLQTLGFTIAWDGLADAQEPWQAELRLAGLQGSRTLSSRQRADRLYAMGEFAAAAELLRQELPN